MSAPTPTRLAALLCLAIPACAQSPMTPTPSQIPATPSTAPATQPQPALPNRPQITYAGHQLTVQANNSSLNQILHEISQHTGITITGGVTDERVFGSYGPGSLAQVLNELLDGTSSNMLFVSSVDNKSAQLILTPRTGGPTPPNPNAMRFNDAEADTDNNPPVNNPPEPPDDSNAQTTPAPAPAPGSQPAGQPGTASGSNNTGSGSSTDSNQQSPNGVRTPQQIFDQLMKLRQQQHAQP
ncbi:hypothetical protein [Edaphobacter sp. 12200R-103]|uniref:hypothetical protein n=1 Tax=Edaphobacter sp. 12200R-103 TaxID=2703788 RepID=UPI00138B3221|nr:hypothetical protein [Edaphobacter sp. 12200R-103]QHS50587.1 hypothetical protein GWR55_01595 [Edaphobacter sp. 12200R-103]